jgi:carbamoyltransferase
MKTNEYVLALSVSHNSSAAVMKNGKIIAAVCEERSRRKKNFIGYPRNAIDYCLHKANIAPSDLTKIAYTTVDNPPLMVKASTNTQFTLNDYWDYYGGKYYQRKLKNESCFNYLKWLRDSPQFNNIDVGFDYSFLTDDILENEPLQIELFRNECIRHLGNHLKIDNQKIQFLDHHTCHAYYAYFGSPFRAEDCLVLTLDGWGDGRNQTVWHAKNDQLHLLSESNQNDLGRIYKLTTLLLGMRPDEHEFKVMGLAPYAKEAYARKAMSILQDLMTVDGMVIRSKNRPKDLLSYLETGWKTERFDNIAAAVQKYTENTACELVKNIVRKTGIHKIVLGGGIAMNIKMNQAIAQLEEIDSIFVCGSSGDESLSIGGCYLLNSNRHSNEPLAHLYLGYDIKDEIEAFDVRSHVDEFAVEVDVSPRRIAELLANGDILACIRGRAEFGARALGNRSILADPRKKSTVQKINEAIKNRDFWMPFALSILEEHSDTYISNPKNISSPYMAISMRVDERNYEKIEAGTHPYDKTVRPQFVTTQASPEYYKIIKEFYKLTGVPALLNTSFNLHGEPIVDTIEDGIRTFRNSGLDHLLIEDRIILSKRL